MDLHKALNEALDGLYNNPSYGGYSDAPRKDWGPQSNQYGYNFPYQKGNPSFPPVGPPTEQTADMPWPLQTITDDLVKSFMSLLEASNKIENCLRLNTSLEKNQREKLNSLSKYSLKILSAIKDLDAKLAFEMDLASNFEGINPQQERDINKLMVVVPGKKE
jgi:hypothetical protein